jgi:hypothetical protein
LLRYLGPPGIFAGTLQVWEPTQTYPQEKKEKHFKAICWLQVVTKKILPGELLLIDVNVPSTSGRYLVGSTGFGLRRAGHHLGVIKATISLACERQESCNKQKAVRGHFEKFAFGKAVNQRHEHFLPTNGLN